MDRLNGTLRTTFLSLRNRNFRLFFIGQLISNTGNWLTNVAITLLVLKLTGSGLSVGLLAACQYGPILVLSVWGELIADRGNKRRLLLITQGLEMTQSAGLAVIAFMPHPSLAGLYMLATVGGILLSFDNPLRRSFVNEMVRPEDVPNAVVLYSMIVNISRVFGPTLAGLLIVTMGFGWSFTLDALSYLAVILCVLLMRPTELYRVAPASKAEGQIRESLRYVLATPVLWSNFLMLALIGTFTLNFTVTLPLFVTGPLQSNTVMFTTLYSIFSAGAVVCSLVVAHRRLVRITHVIMGAVALGVATICLGLSPWVGVAAVAAFFVGLSSTLFTVSTTALVQVETREDMRGRILALQMALLVGTTPISGPLLGWMADVVGARAPLIVGGAASIAAAYVGYLAARRATYR